MQELNSRTVSPPLEIGNLVIANKCNTAGAHGKERVSSV